MDTLLKKSASASPRRVFRKMVRDMIEADHLPDYEMVEETGDKIRFSRRAVVVDETEWPKVSPAALEAVRSLWPGCDVYAVVADWQTYWVRSGRPQLGAADALLSALPKRWHSAAATDVGRAAFSLGRFIIVNLIA